MKKRICRLLLAFLLVLVFCVSMAAAEQTGAQLSCVTDTAGLLYLYCCKLHESFERNPQ